MQKTKELMFEANNFFEILQQKKVFSKEEKSTWFLVNCKLLYSSNLLIKLFLILGTNITYWCNF